MPGLRREQLDADERLIRTWAMRGTVFLIAAEDRDWIHALHGERNRDLYAGHLAKRGADEAAHALVEDAVELLHERPRSRAALLADLVGERGHPKLDQRPANVIVPWLSALGVVVTRPDGCLVAADPPTAVDHDEALATLARRYLGGYGPADAADLAYFSGLPLGQARRGLDAIGPLEDAGGGLLALPGSLDAEPDPAPAAHLLAAYDDAMLGWASRSPLVAADDDRHVLPGGGVIRPTVLARGRASGIWKVTGSGRRRRLEVEWFGRPAAPRALGAEAADVGRFLGVELAT